MREPQLQEDFISLPIEQGSAWPWIDAVDAGIPNAVYGVGLCGFVQYQVTDLDGLDTDLVTFDAAQARLIFAP